jgi:outer membrane protein OmpA-like peptidoglycan-associated protein
MRNDFFQSKNYFMKRLVLIVLLFAIVKANRAQNIVKEHYTVSGGLLGAANWSKFRITENNPADEEYKMKPGWSAGGWVNFPVSNKFSIEPQVMYSSYTYKTNSALPLILNDGKITYISVPVLMKFHTGDKFAFTLGPQVDFLSSVKDERNIAVDDDFKSTSFSVSGGLEILPHARVSIFGRYIYGLTNMNDGGEANAIEYKNAVVQAGLKLRLFGKKVPADSDGDGVSDPKDKCPNVFGYARYDGCPIPDRDNDGINDEEDKCPDQPGTAKYNGCPIPDRDKDGINDEEDKCPDQPGIAKYNGCPIPDTDGDGINDEEDRCPTQAGPANRNGCPVTDRDNDGISDEEDRCPDVAGIAANNGCPEVPANVTKTLSVAAQNITFGTANAKLMSKSNASLDQIVTIMNENPTLKIRVEAHTDNAGTDDANMKLSQDRADAVKAYLVGKGISEDRITSEGFGESRPIADNSNSAGRVKNRRVEIKMVY